MTERQRDRERKGEKEGGERERPIEEKWRKKNIWILEVLVPGYNLESYNFPNIFPQVSTN